MSFAGQGQRTIELNAHGTDFTEKPSVRKRQKEAIGRAHGPDGMRTRRADTDFEEIKDTGVHGFSKPSAGGRIRD